ncbi:hypothetical protein LX99_00074 [Mucilaginibacter oryzae]|uniref:DUF2264 domain-containing protein n=1 Tax=Mucilaginibacter oryzae TaxID=468058 RepID=A0A316HGW2_9SPHI|nr:DUF2264 domain-containing protein [Mucilaginibacter oryzae]PWK79617.1 hypothetical protein LX99_00074 [Mucilaginibacter oryzae]
MKKAAICLLLIYACISAAAQNKRASGLADRKLWLAYLDKIARPVLSNLAADKLKQNMPVMFADDIDDKQSRHKVAYLEAFGRTLSGIAPWLQLEGGDAAETELRGQYRAWALKAIANAVNPQAKSYLEWKGGQPLVDASFMALGLVRAPWLWEHLDEQTKKNVIKALETTRATVPVYSNWILFSGMIEAFFCKYDLGYDPVRIEYGIREFTEHWYVGDGMYADGMNFHFDYYNSIVIQPYLNTMLQVLVNTKGIYKPQEKAGKIAQRYAQILERLINTDGTYPATGRSIVYRAGVFHLLADVALNRQLPASLPPAQVRCALTAVITKTLESPSTFTNDGWLNIGLYGKQPGLADFYITTGSLYLCTDIFLPLGLPASDAFWSDTALPWSAVKIWSGQNVPADHALDLK